MALPNLRSNEGFTILEVLLVGAIVGILSSIAIPSIRSYEIRARRAEAKVMLGHMYLAEKMFSAEFLTYSSRLDAIGFAPDGVVTYNYGFKEDLAAPYAAGVPKGTAGCMMTCPSSNCPGAKWSCKASALCNLDSAFNAYVRKNSFVAGVHIHWDGNNQGPKEGHWIDHNKVVGFVPDGASN
jgi:prepilin-type N-terminal cleavage/methylation domain-containing protein